MFTNSSSDSSSLSLEKGLKCFFPGGGDRMQAERKGEKEEVTRDSGLGKREFENETNQTHYSALSLNIRSVRFNRF